jgi:hypothetical protein
MKNKRIKIMLAVTAILLCIPLIAMQFTDEVSWTVFDFMVMGTLLLGTGLLGEFATRKVTKKDHRIVLYIAIIVAFLLVWAELAVGIIGTPFAGN